MKRAGLLLASLLAGATPAVADQSVFAPPAPAAQTPTETVQAAAGRAWSVSSGLVAVAASATSPAYFSALLVNPTTSGCTSVVTFRRYTNLSTGALAFTTFKGAVQAVAGSTTVNAGSRLGGAAGTSGLTLSYATSSAGFTTGSAGVSSALFAASDKEISAVEVLPPGTALGVQISGQSGLLTTAVTVAATFSGYCS